MTNKTRVIITLILFVVGAAFLGAGCRIADLKTGEEQILEGEGIFVGQIDSNSVEIEIDGQSVVFGFGDGVSVIGIGDGTAVVFSYIEEETRPILQSIEAIGTEDEVLVGEGIYIGQIDSHSVEIEVEGQPEAFAIGEELSLEGLEYGSRIAFTYREEQYRLLLLTVQIIEEPLDGGIDNLGGEGILEGQIDSQSVEIKRNRVFILGEKVSVENIENGSLVAFTYTESGLRAVINTLEAVDQPLEGEITHGNLIRQVDNQSVEIQYYQAFALGEGVSVEGIADGSEVIFTYRKGLHRPVLTSLKAK